MNSNISNSIPRLEGDEDIDFSIEKDDEDEEEKDVEEEEGKQEDNVLDEQGQIITIKSIEE